MKARGIVVLLLAIAVATTVAGCGSKSEGGTAGQAALTPQQQEIEVLARYVQAIAAADRPLAASLVMDPTDYELIPPEDEEPFSLFDGGPGQGLAWHWEGTEAVFESSGVAVGRITAWPCAIPDALALQPVDPEQTVKVYMLAQADGAWKIVDWCEAGGEQDMLAEHPAQ